MITPVRPMLAAAISDISQLVFPLIGTPKIDGIRCLTLPTTEESAEGDICSPVTRALKPIPNRHVRRRIARECSPGLDGELIIPTATFQQVSSYIMGYSGEPEFEYHVFDHLLMLRDTRWTKGVLEAYRDRLSRLCHMKLPVFCHVIPHTHCPGAREVEKFEDECVEGGYEGICLRAPHSPYKFGRSTLKEHWLLKLKRFQDDEAIVIGAEELMRNQNEVEVSALGYQERCSKSAGLIPGNTLGALLVRDVKTGVEFAVGSGFSQNERLELWAGRDALIGRTLTYRHQPHGAKDRPRIPIFKGWRRAGE